MIFVQDSVPGQVCRGDDPVHHDSAVDSDELGDRVRCPPAPFLRVCDGDLVLGVRFLYTRRFQAEAAVDAEDVPDAAAGPLRLPDVVQHPQDGLVPEVTVPSALRPGQGHAEPAGVAGDHPARTHLDLYTASAPVVRMRQGVGDHLPEGPKQVGVVRPGDPIGDAEPRAYHLRQPVDHVAVELEQVALPSGHSAEVAERPLLALVEVLMVV